MSAAPTLQIRKAERKQAKLRLALAGPSGSGKTYSALLIAMGLGGGKIGMIDTERGSGELYSHLCDFDVISLDPPYTVSRYIEAMKMFEQAKYDTIIIDSITHEWAGEGGLLRSKEQLDTKAAASGNFNPFASWAKITPHHDRFISAMLSSPCHIVATMRAKSVYVQEGSTIKKRGVEPVQRDQIEFEFTVVMDINAEHIAVASKDRTELFGGWMEQITPRVGERLLHWLNVGETVSPERESNDHSDATPPASPSNPVSPDDVGRGAGKLEQEGTEPGAGEQGGEASAPADDNDKAMLGALYKVASRKVGSVKAFNHLKGKGLWPIAELRKNQVEQCAEELQSL